MKRLVLTILILFCVSEMIADGARYLIITHDNFYNAIQPLADWKNKKGVLTKLTNKTTLESLGYPWTNAGIKNYIQDAYNNWQIKPKYVLLVGHPPLLESFNWNGVYTDNPYSDMNDDTLSEIYVGRFPVLNTHQCSTIVKKVLLYERIPNMLDTTWYRKGTTIANGRATQLTTWLEHYRQNCMYARELMLINAAYVHVDTFFNPPPGEVPYNADSVLQAVDNGRSYLLYRGEASGNWSYPFNISPELLNNYCKFPFIISGSCATVNLFYQGYAGDRWILSGTPSNPTGAVAYFGTTYIPGYSSSQYRGAVVCGLFKALFEEESITAGSIAKRGKDSLYHAYGLPYSGKHYVEWTLLGDPELNLWTAVPKTMLVTHEKYIAPGLQTYTVTVRDSVTQNGVSNALVCVMMPNDTGVYRYDYTDNSGNVTFTINPARAPDSMWVTVTARNYRPYEGKCDVLFLASENGTFPNQGKHLVRRPNSSELHRVYENNNSILYSMSTNWGQTWSTPIYLGDGNYPCIAIGPMGETPWILWGSSSAFGPLYSAVKRTDGTWKIREIFPIGEELHTTPSMVLATLKNEEGDLAYCVFRTHNQILFGAFDTLNDYCVSLIDDYDPCLAPSISITPADLIHIVWQRDIDEGKIFYKTTIEKVHPDEIRQGRLPEWSREVRISEWALWPVEPASNPSTEAYGDYVYAVWRGPFDENNQTGEIWQRARWVERPYWWWEEPENKSETRDNESNYPVMSTDFVTVWHESVSGNNWDIWGRFEAEPNAQSFFQTEKSSKYPHIDGYWVPGIIWFFCNTIWTEEIAPSVYEVKYGRREYIPRKDFSEIPCYYAVDIGDSITSPYCTYRDGYFRYEPYAIDYSNQKLKYKLPYLHPKYYYDLRAIVYNRAQNNWTQQFWTDSTLTGTLTIRPNRPETLTIRIPQAAYERDAEILQEIRRVLGARAVIADLKLYQIELIDSSKSNGGIQSVNIASLQRPILNQSYPNPFKSQTAIRYSLTASSKASLTIYDISGRAVRNLVDENKESGIYSVNWDGRDDKGRILAQGVYFYRLKTDCFSDTKRLVLVR